MARYLARACPRCNSYVEIVMREPENDRPLQAVNGKCVRCSYRFRGLSFDMGDLLIQVQEAGREVEP
jgi:hypothetical protein